METDEEDEAVRSRRSIKQLKAIFEIPQNRSPIDSKLVSQRVDSNTKRTKSQRTIWSNTLGDEGNVLLYFVSAFYFN